MAKTLLSMTMSLDGFIAAPNDDDAGLHHWVFGGAVPITQGGITFSLTSEPSAEIFNEVVTSLGAVVMGRRAFNISGEDAPFQLPTFVLSHQARETVAREGTIITFVTDGIEAALDQAQAAAGGKTVAIFGGANTAQQYLQAGLIDDLQIHLVPVLLGDGIRLFDDLGTDRFELECTRVIETPDVTHLKYRLMK